MKIIALISVYICCVLMFFLKKEYKIAIVFLSSIIFTLVIVPTPFYKATTLIATCFLLSEIPHISSFIRNSKKSIIWKITGIVVVSVVISIIMSPHLNNSHDIVMYIRDELFAKYLIIIYAFWAYKDDKSLKPTLKLSFIGLIILTLFGILNYITKNADFVSEMMSGIVSNAKGANGNDAGSYYTFADRFRVQAMFANPFDYGYICLLILLIHLYGYNRHLEKLKSFIIVLICSLFGIISCGCRTILFCFMISISIYLLLALKPQKYLRILLVIIFLIPLSYQTIPAVQEQTDKMLSIFNENSQVTGSSLEMRSLQYATVMFYIQDSPWFGRGIGFFGIDLGWGNGQIVDKDLAGLEGVVMSKLLEEGFIGLILYLSYYIILIVYLLKKRKESRETSALGISIIALYLTFANMTGELLSVFPSLLCIGYVLKVLDNDKVNITLSQKVNKQHL